MNRRTISGIFAFVLALCPALTLHAATAQGPITHQENINWLLVREGANNTTPGIETPATDKSTEAKEEVNLEIPRLSKAESLTRLAEIYPKTTRPTKPLTDQADRDKVKDLELPVLFEKIDRTQTIVGSVALANMLTNTSDLATAKNRQTFIRQLVENPQLLDQYDAIIANFDESTFLSWWNKNNKPTNDLINALYPGVNWNTHSAVKSLHTNSAGMESVVRLKNLMAAVSVAMQPVIIPISVSWVKHKIFYHLAIHNSEFYKNAAKDYSKLAVEPALDAISQSVNQQEAEKCLKMSELTVANFQKEWGYEDNHFKYALNTYKDYTVGGKGVIAAKDFYNKEIATSEYKNLMLAGASAYGALIVGSYLYSVAITAKNEVTTKNAINYLQTKLIGAASLVNALKQVNTCAQQDKTVAAGVSSYQSTMNNLFSKPSKLVQMLQTNTFVGQASFFSLSGRVLAANALMEDSKAELVQALQTIGELDACVAIAKLVKESYNNRVGYCFVEFVDSNQPYIQIDDFWNPMVSPDVVVTNSIACGDNQTHRGMIVTGSNTGGKSTLLKGITISLWLAHTFGIAPARTATLTPFTYVGSSMNIIDDIASGDSLYQAEVRRTQSLIKSLESLDNNQFGFVVIDELFRGTSPAQAEKGTYECAQRLMKIDNAVCIIATHYKTLVTKLEQETNGACKNYKVDIIKNVDGTLTRPFKLEAGIGSVDVAAELLHGALDTPVVA